MTDEIETKVDIKTIAAALKQFEGVFSIYDQDLNLIFANDAAFEILPAYFTALKNGASIAEATHSQVVELGPNASERELELRTNAFISKFESGADYELNIADNRTFHISHQKLGPKHILGRGVDVTDLKQQQSRMETLAELNFKLANTDQLTGLSNRRHFMKHLSLKITNTKIGLETDKTFFVGLIDLNGFKNINDVYGHTIGDELLTALAKRATKETNTSTILARLGGDEFALILDSPMSHDDIQHFSKKLCSRISEPQNISGNDIQVHASLGWSCYPKDGETPSDLLRKADYALYKSKQSDTRKAFIFSGSDENHIRRQSEISLQLRNGNLHSELFLEFQPIHDSKEGVITGFEALARWNNPLLGLIRPNEFIPLAEKTGCISDVTKILFQKALGVAVHWPKNIDLHFNLSAIDLGKTEVIKDLIRITKTASFPAQSVVFEVTETAVIETFKRMSEVFDLLQANSFRLALDDFGKGFSSLNYLTRIPVSILKVDKSFTDSLTLDSKEETIIKTIHYLCQNLNIDCIIEGVEHDNQFEQLRALSFTKMQGFYFSKPIGVDEMAAYLLNQPIGPKAHSSDTITPLSFSNRRNN